MNPLTTASGIITIFCALGGAFDKYFDGDPKTMPDWGATGAAVATGVGLVCAKDREKKRKDEPEKEPQTQL